MSLVDQLRPRCEVFTDRTQARFLRGGSVTLCAFLAFACQGCRLTPLEKAVQQAWPSVAPATKSAEAIDAQYQNLNNIDVPNLLINVSKSDFERFGPEVLMTVLKETDGPRSGQPTVSKVSLSLGNQEAITTAAFDHFFKELDCRVKGEAELHAAVSVEGDMLVLRPSFSTVRIKKIAIPGSPKLDVVVPLINKALAQFLDNLNARISDTTIPINLGLLQTFRPIDMLKSSPGLASVAGPDIVVNSALGGAAVLIDDNGIHAIAQIVNLSAEDFERILSTLSKTPQNIPPTLTPELVAFFSQCGKHFPVEKKDDATFLRFRSLCTQYHSPVNATVSSIQKHIAAQGTNPKIAFAQLNSSFRTKAVQIDGEPNLPWRVTSIVVSKSVVADALSKFASQPHISAKLVEPTMTQHFNQELRTDKAPNLECEKNSGACDINYSCDQSTDCSAVMGCPSDCAWYDVGCHAWKPTCESIKAAKKGACESAKSAARASCETGKALAKSSCEAAKSARRAGCETNQGWLNQFQQLNIGRIEGNIFIENPEIALELDSISVASDLSAAEVKGSVSAQTHVAADTKFTPWEGGHLLCSSQWTGHVTATASVDKNDLDLKGQLTATQNEDGSLDLVVQSQKEHFVLKVKPAPMVALLAQNPQLEFICSGAIAGLSISAHLRDQALKDSFDFDLPPQIFHLHIRPQVVTIGEHEVSIFPVWKDKSIQAVANAK